MKPKLEGLTPLIQVFDMPTSIRFYRDVLGFEVASSSPARGPDDHDWVLLRLDGMELMLNTAYELDKRPSQPPSTTRRAHRDTALFIRCRDLDSAYAYFTRQGVDVKEPKVAPYGMKQLWLDDPDGYVICLQWPAS